MSVPTNEYLDYSEINEFDEYLDCLDEVERWKYDIAILGKELCLGQVLYMRLWIIDVRTM